MNARLIKLIFKLKYIKIKKLIKLTTHGEVSEWSNVPAWKASIPKGIGGSNPLLSATLTHRQTSVRFSCGREEKRIRMPRSDAFDGLSLTGLVLRSNSGAVSSPKKYSTTLSGGAFLFASMIGQRTRLPTQ